MPVLQGKGVQNAQGEMCWRRNGAAPALLLQGMGTQNLGIWAWIWNPGVPGGVLNEPPGFMLLLVMNGWVYRGSLLALTPLNGCFNLPRQREQIWG